MFFVSGKSYRVQLFFSNTLLLPKGVYQVYEDGLKNLRGCPHGVKPFCIWISVIPLCSLLRMKVSGYWVFIKMNTSPFRLLLLIRIIRNKERDKLRKEAFNRFFFRQILPWNEEALPRLVTAGLYIKILVETASKMLGIRPIPAAIGWILTQ